MEEESCRADDREAAVSSRIEALYRCYECLDRANGRRPASSHAGLPRQRCKGVKW